MAELWGIVIAGWIGSAIVGAIVGSRRDSAGTGALLGLLFGPLGAIAAFALDGRARCPQCLNRIDTGVVLCPTCHAELGWFNGTVGLAAQVQKWVQDQRDQHISAARMARLRQEDAERQQAKFIYWCGLVGQSLWVVTCGAVRLAVVAPLTALNRLLFTMADGSPVGYRMLQVLWFVLLPLLIVGGITCVAQPGKQPSPKVVEPHRDEGLVPEADTRPPRVQAPEERVEIRVPLPPLDEAAQKPRPQAEAVIREPQELPAAPAKQESGIAEAPEREMAPADRRAFPEPPREPVPDAARPIAIDGGEIAERVAEAEDRERRKARIKAIEKEIEELSKKRRQIQDQSRARAAQDAYNARIGVRIFGESSENAQQRYKQEAEALFGKMRLLREEINSLKREEARERRP